MLRNFVLFIALNLVVVGSAVNSAEAATKPLPISQCGKRTASAVKRQVYDLGAALEAPMTFETQAIKMAFANPARGARDEAAKSAYGYIVANGDMNTPPEILLAFTNYLVDESARRSLLNYAKSLSRDGSGEERFIAIEAAVETTLNSKVQKISKAYDTRAEISIELSQQAKLIEALRTMVHYRKNLAMGLAEMVLIADIDARVLPSDLLSALREHIRAGVQVINAAQHPNPPTDALVLRQVIEVLRQTHREHEASHLHGATGLQIDAPEEYTHSRLVTRGYTNLLIEIDRVLAARGQRSGS